MAIYSLKAVQKIPVSLERAWDFFSSPANLQVITPADMKFKIISRHHGEKIYPGQLIEYKVSPFPGLSLYWMTEIVRVNEKSFFADEQKKGPYKMWRHRHHFREIEGGVEMTDIVYYENPLWLIGDLANSLFVRAKVRKIFEYRFKKIEQLFGKWEGQQLLIETG